MADETPKAEVVRFEKRGERSTEADRRLVEGIVAGKKCVHGLAANHCFDLPDAPLAEVMAELEREPIVCGSFEGKSSLPEIERMLADIPSAHPVAHLFRLAYAEITFLRSKLDEIDGRASSAIEKLTRAETLCAELKRMIRDVTYTNARLHAKITGIQNILDL